VVNPPPSTPPPATASTYTRRVFAAALGNILLVEFICWVFLPWFLAAVFAIPVLLVDLAVSALLSRRGGTLGQLGRGMLIGWIAAPLTLAIFLPAYAMAGSLGFL
jgi:hypothetical protein